MTRRKRVGQLQAALSAAVARSYEEGWAAARVKAGTASLEDYRFLLADFVEGQLQLFVPTLPLVRAVRCKGIPPAARQWFPWQSLARTVLSFRPEEALPTEQKDALARLDQVWSDRSAGLDERLDAAQARLMLGKGEGAFIRHRIWDSGFVEEQARGDSGDYQRWHIEELIDHWQPWLAYGRSEMLRQGWPEDEVDGRVLVVSTQALADFILEDWWVTG